MREPNLNPPEDELPDCEELCPNCEAELDWSDEVYIFQGTIIGCKHCVVKQEVCEWKDEHTPSESDIKETIADERYH